MASSGASVAHLTSLSSVKQNVPGASQHTYRILTLTDDVFKAAAMGTQNNTATSVSMPVPNVVKMNQSQRLMSSVNRKIDDDIGAPTTLMVTKMDKDDSNDDYLSDEEANDLSLQLDARCRRPGNSSSVVTAIVQGPDGQYFVPVQSLNSMSDCDDALSATHTAIEEVARKRELRLLKNREAAKECRRKKKDYVRCLENRVALLENQNKTLINELKSLKELYCQKEASAS